MPPFVTVNCAMSADGKIALSSRRQTRISSEEDIARVHRLRNSCDAILVGIETVLADDPSLLVKEKFVRKVRQPLRVVLDSRGRTPVGAKVTSPGAQTLIALAAKQVNRRWGGNVEAMVLGEGDRVSIPGLLKELDRRNVKKLLVEGGSEVIWSFISERAVDRLMIYVGSLVLGGSGPTPACGEGTANLENAPRLRLNRIRRLGDGVLLVYEPQR
jgi:2,5-diamino-6-(ribosylamino)-4(3H)-pyrimidinone 5'-phosphate reductase